MTAFTSFDNVYFLIWTYLYLALCDFATQINAPMKNTDPKKYESWRIQQEPTCNINYIGSAPNMESTGALSIFKRSLENYGLRYLNYCGDGDSKSFQSVENVYEGAKVVKYECIGHYQK